MRTRLFSFTLVFLATSLPATNACAQATYTLKPTPKTVAWGYYDAKAAPVLRVKSGDTVELLTSHCDAEFWAQLPGMTRNQLCEWVGPAQPGETSEVPVGGVKNAAVLDGQRRQVRVTNQRTASLAIQQHLPEQAPVLISGWQETRVRLLHPLIDNLDGFLWSESLSGESWVRDDPKKGRYRLPW